MKIEINRIHELVDQLSKAGKSYYQDNEEIMSNFEYDKLYDELIGLENKSGIVLTNSPTVKVGYELLSELPKERHITAMLSLDKTKEVENLKDWLKDEEGLMSWKLDGLTIVLTYENGELVKGVTRGNGEIGEVITNNVKVFNNVPLRISEKSPLTIRGEAVIKYSDFNKINELLDDENKYKNPRNLCSGSVRQLNNEITAKRNVNFFAFQLVSIDNVDFETKSDQLEFMKDLGFAVVEIKKVTQNTIDENVEYFYNQISKNDFASDGLVLTYDNITYSQSLGQTSKFPRDSIAFKWQDETAVTKLIEIEWSASRTGLINPVAIFEPVSLEGTTVARASVHNLSILEELELGIGDEIEVYKANMIIPQIANNLTKSHSVEIPKDCPICGEETTVKQVNDVKTLFCENVTCPAKLIKSFAHFVSRNALNIEGLSEATIEKFIQHKFILKTSDLFILEQHKEELVELEGFGVKSYDNLIEAIEKGKEVNIANFIYALGISNVGLSNAKLLTKYFKYDINKLIDATFEEMVEIDGFGEIIAKNVVDYFGDEDNKIELEKLLEFVKLEFPETNDTKQSLEGLTFVITGSLEHYNNRNELKDIIESKGGKVTNSVTVKTNYLINNDSLSNSSKNKKAKSLEIPIITEEDFMKLI